MNDDDKHEELLAVMQNLADLQIYTAIKLTRLQAQVLTLEGILSAIQLNAGADPQELEAKVRAAFAQHDSALLDGLWNWMDKHGIARPKADNPWWDRPSSE